MSESVGLCAVSHKSLRQIFVSGAQSIHTALSIAERVLNDNFSVDRLWACGGQVDLDRMR